MGLELGDIPVCIVGEGTIMIPLLYRTDLENTAIPSTVKKEEYNMVYLMA